MLGFMLLEALLEIVVTTLHPLTADYFEHTPPGLLLMGIRRFKGSLYSKGFGGDDVHRNRAHPRNAGKRFFVVKLATCKGAGVIAH
jgi:hypothetical protein